MTLKSGLATALVAALVSALVTVGALSLVMHQKPGELLAAAFRGGDSQPAKAGDTEIIEIVKKYLTANPEILVEMTTELDKRQATEQAAQQKKVIGENADKIFRSPESFVAGNPDGDVSVVEFFDYNCGYCKRALDDVVKLVNSDNKVRLVLKELPIFGEESEGAAKAALASAKQGKYFEMHQKLLAEPGKANEAKALQIAGELGLDIEQLKKDMQDPAIKAGLEENQTLAQTLGAQGTPFYLIGDHSLAGAPEDLYDQLTKNVAEIRAKGCSTTC